MHMGVVQCGVGVSQHRTTHRITDSGKLERRPPNLPAAHVLRGRNVRGAEEVAPLRVAIRDVKIKIPDCLLLFSFFSGVGAREGVI